MSRYAPGYTGPMTTAGGVPRRGPKATGTPGKPKVGTPGVRVFDDSGMGIKTPTGTVRPTKPQPDPVKEPVMDIGYRPDFKGMKEKAAASKKKMMGMAMGGMAKKGYNKGGMANCGASMKPAQGKGKK
jgi:hypothetical protein